MARLVGLPPLHELEEEIKNKNPHLRAGQYVWNKYGQRGIDGGGWPDLFYADDEKALTIIRQYYQ